MSIEDLDKNVNVNFRVPASYRDAMKTKAKQQGLNLSKFFRNCMDEALNEKETVHIPLDYLNADDEKIFSLRVSKEKLNTFQSLCSSMGRDAGKIIRAFIYATLPDSSIGVTDSLFYVIVFLENSLAGKGYKLSSLKEVQKQQVTSEYPLIQEEKYGKSMIYKVSDAETKTLYTIPFRKE